MKKHELFYEVARFALSEEATDEQILACMIVFHTMSMQLQTNTAVEDAGENTILAPLTRRHSAEIVSSALQALGRRAAAEFWYCEYDRRTPFEVVSDVPMQWSPAIEAMRAKMCKSGFVSEFYPE